MNTRKNLRRTFAALAAVLVTLALAPAPRADEAAPAPEQVTLKLKDGRTLEGALVAEKKDEVVIRMPYGEIPVRRDEIAEIVRAAPPAASGEGGGEESDEPATEEIATLTMKDRVVLRGRLTDLDDEWEVETDLGAVRVKKRNVVDMKREVVARRASAARAEPVVREEAVDLGLGVAVVRPSPAWTFADRVPDPLARILMRRADPDVIFRVAVAEPMDADRREVDQAHISALTTILKKELSERYKASRGLTVAVERWRGMPVYRIAYQADTRIFASRFSVREIRFPWRDAMLVLQASAPLAPGELSESAEAAREAEAAFEAFGFSGAIEARPDRYAHAGLGVRIARPRPDWRIVPAIADPEVLCEILPPDGFARCTLTVSKERATGTAGEAIDALERSLTARSRHFRKLARADKTIGGANAVDFRYQDFDGGSKLLELRRLAVVRSGRLVELVAARPATEERGAKAIEQDAALDALFASLEAGPSPSPYEVYRRGAKAIELRAAAERKLEEKNDAQGAIADLTEALALNADYGLAYVLRARAWADAKDEEKALRDYEAASSLLDDPAIARMIARVENARGKSLLKEDYPQGLKLLRAALEKDPKNRGYREDVIRAMLDRGRALASQEKHEVAISELRDAYARFPEEVRFKQELVKTHVAWARSLQEKGDLYKARGIVKRALKIQEDDAQARMTLERIEKEIAKKEEGGKKKGK